MSPLRHVLFRMVCNPIMSLVLLLLLIADIRSLSLQNDGASTCGGWYLALARPTRLLPSQPPALDAWIIRDNGSLRLGGSMGGKAAPSKYAEELPEGAAPVAWAGARIHHDRRGFWAITRDEVAYRVVFDEWQPLTDAERAQARQIYVDRFLAPDWSSDPALLARLRCEDFNVTSPIWKGYARNLIALAAAIGLCASLAWLPRTPAYIRARLGAHRLQRGLCPRCSYNVHGLRESRCPECGTPIISAGAPP